jgi:hypothetical protein
MEPIVWYIFYLCFWSQEEEFTPIVLRTLAMKCQVYLYKEDGVCMHVRYARPHLCMDLFKISLNDACASKVTPKLCNKLQYSIKLIIFTLIDKKILMLPSNVARERLLIGSVFLLKYTQIHWNILKYTQIYTWIYSNILIIL